MARFRISLFSRFKVESDCERSSDGFEARKVQELFGYLLLSRDRLHPRETLAELLWGDISSLRARKYLRQALWQLQAALKSEDDVPGGGVLTVDSEWVGINPKADIWSDVAEFENAYASAEGITGFEIDPQIAEAMGRALELRTGSLLEGWYHDWCLFERERLQIMYQAMLNKLMDYCEAREEFEIGLSYGRRILQQDRAHERTHWRMMRLSYLAGDAAECGPQEIARASRAQAPGALFGHPRARRLADLSSLSPIGSLGLSSPSWPPSWPLFVVYRLLNARPRSIKNSGVKGRLRAEDGFGGDGTCALGPMIPSLLDCTSQRVTQLCVKVSADVVAVHPG